MRIPPKIAMLAALALGMGIATQALADGRHHHRHSHVGVVIGVPLVSPWYVAPRYYYQPVVTVPAGPPTYIERGSGPGSDDGYWYYCPGPQTYYPYVRSCPEGWMRVVPTPPQ